jgi:hypothetical protein
MGVADEVRLGVFEGVEVQKCDGDVGRVIMGGGGGGVTNASWSVSPSGNPLGFHGNTTVRMRATNSGSA